MKECPECKKRRLEEEAKAKKSKEKHGESCCCNHREQSTGCGCGIEHTKKTTTTCSCGCGTEKKVNPIKYDIIKIAICALLLVVSYILTLDSLDAYKDVPNWVALFSPAWVVIGWCGYPIFKGAIKNLRRGKITSALLISIAIVASIALEFFMTFSSQGNGHDHYLFAAGEIAALMELGTIIEDYTVKKSRKGIEELIALAPKKALLKTPEGIVEVDISTVKTGDIVVVKPDQMIPVDGVVVSGSSSVDESSITGEYLPKDKTLEDKVFAGTRNGFGLIEVCTIADVEDSVVMRLIKLTEECEKNKAPIARTADRWASYIVPAAIILSIVVFLISTFALKASYVDGLVRAVTVLVVFCPCSLALATPTAIAAGLGNASKKGVLIKSGQALECLAKCKAVGFDKTGTLTTGKLSVEKVVSYNLDQQYFEDICATLESSSSHPIAVAVSLISQKRYPISDVENILGSGLRGVVDNKKIEIVKWGALEEIDPDVEKEYQKGHTVIGVKIDEKVAGYISLSDTIKKDAAAAITDIKALKVNTFLVTGDNQKAAAKVADSFMLDEVYAEQLPHQKLDRIREKQKSEKVAFIGDGANDAPALGAADVGIALGAMGNSISMDVADICLMEDNLKRIPTAIKLSKKVLKKIHFNIVLAMCINAASVVLSLFGILTPVLGALVHNCSSVFVCSNSATILLYDRKK